MKNHVEFLPVYGWAIWIIMVIVGTLAYFGVFSPPDKFNPATDYCTKTEGVNEETLKCWKYACDAFDKNFVCEQNCIEKTSKCVSWQPKLRLKQCGDDEFPIQIWSSTNVSMMCGNESFVVTLEAEKGGKTHMNPSFEFKTENSTLDCQTLQTNVSGEEIICGSKLEYNLHGKLIADGGRPIILSDVKIGVIDSKSAYCRDNPSDAERCECVKNETNGIRENICEADK